LLFHSHSLFPQGGGGEFIKAKCAENNNSRNEGKLNKQKEIIFNDTKGRERERQQALSVATESNH
jgi:hypothetical protein